MFNRDDLEVLLERAPGAPLSAILGHMASGTTGPLEEIERAVQAALGTYANVHRGAGHHSAVTTRLYEQAREIVLAHLGLSAKEHVVVFCTPRRAARLQERLGPGHHQVHRPAGRRHPAQAQHARRLCQGPGQLRGLPLGRVHGLPAVERRSRLLGCHGPPHEECLQGPDQ